MVKIINSFGFMVKLVAPIKLPPNVIDVLRGFYNLGYTHIAVDYIIEPSDEYAKPSKFKSKRIIVYDEYKTGTKLFNLSDAPDYNQEDYKWMKPGTSYPIKLLLDGVV